MSVADVIDGAPGGTTLRLLGDYSDATGIWLDEIEPGTGDADQPTVGYRPATAVTAGGRSCPLYDGIDDYLETSTAMDVTWTSGHSQVMAFVADFADYGPGWVIDSIHFNNYVTGGGTLNIAGCSSDGDVVGLGPLRIIMHRDGGTGTTYMVINGVEQATTSGENLGIDWGAGGQLYGMRGGLNYPFNGMFGSWTHGVKTVGSWFDFIEDIDAALLEEIEGGGGTPPHGLQLIYPEGSLRRWWSQQWNATNAEWTDENDGLLLDQGNSTYAPTQVTTPSGSLALEFDGTSGEKDFYNASTALSFVESTRYGVQYGCIVYVPEGAGTMQVLRLHGLDGASSTLYVSGGEIFVEDPYIDGFVIGSPTLEPGWHTVVVDYGFDGSTYRVTLWVDGDDVDNTTPEGFTFPLNQLQDMFIGFDDSADPTTTTPTFRVGEIFVAINYGGYEDWSDEAEAAHTYLQEMIAIHDFPITAELGTFALTGIAANFRVGMPAALGTFALTGLQTGLRAQRKMPAQQATFTLTGIAMTPRVTMPAALGTFALTGLDNAMRAQRKVTAELGAFTLSGIANALWATRLMPAQQATFALTLIAAALKVAMPAAVGEFVLTGNDASIVYGETMLAELGVFALSGINADLRTQRKVTAEQATFALSGIAASLLGGRRLPADAGAFSLSGIAASLLGGRRMPANLGTFALVGSDASLRAQRKVTAELGAFTLSGIAIVFGVKMPAAAGAFTLSGIDIATRLTRRIPAEQGAFVLTGIDVSFGGERSVSAELGVFALTGNAIDLEAQRKVTAERGVFVLTGIDNAGRFTRYIALEQGVFLVDGNEADLIIPGRIAADTAVFELAGSDAGLRAQRRAAMEPGAFALAGNDADLARAATTVAERGVFTLAGNAAELEAQRRLEADRATFVLTGRDVELGQQLRVEAELGTFTLSGNTTDLRAQRRLVSERGVFALTGAAAVLARSHLFTAERGVFTFAGFEAGLVRVRRIPAERGVFSFVGVNAILQRGDLVGVVAECGVFIVTGHATDARPPARITAFVMPLTIIEARVIPSTIITARVRMTQPLEVGDRAAIPILFRSGLSNALGDPTAWGITVRRIEDVRGNLVDDAPTVYTYGTDDELTRSALGTFLATIPCTAVGKWHYTIESTGPVLPGTKTGIYFVSTGAQ